MPDLLATAEDLRTFLGDDVDEEDVSTERAELLLRIASGEVRAFTGRLFDPVEDETVTLNGRGTTVLLLPEVPVVDVTSVIEAPGTDPLELDGPDAEQPDFEWSEEGVLRRIDGAVFRRRFRWYEVTFSHGFDQVPDDIAGVVLKVAARAVESPAGGKRQETIGRYSYTSAGEAAGIGLYDTDRAKLIGWRIGGRHRSGSSTGS